MHTANPRRYPEVLFPEGFTNRQPWDRNPNFAEDPLAATIPIFRLSHVTHDAEAQAICTAGFTFIPRPKYGKSGRAGETYKFTGDDDNYEEIRDSDRVFPGYLSWWGIDVKRWYIEYEEGAKLRDSILEERDNGRYVPTYLAYPPESQYGNRAFSTSLSQILQDYSTARQGQTPCLKVGGTLRYRNEICYVIVVCTEEDNLEMPAVNADYPQFQPNGLVDQNGVVIDYQKTPNFNATSIIKSAKDGKDRYGKNKYKYFSWEQLAFAFYFPTQGFVCTDFDRFVVPHYEQNCPKCWGNN